MLAQLLGLLEARTWATLLHCGLLVLLASAYYLALLCKADAALRSMGCWLSFPPSEVDDYTRVIA